MTWRSLGATVLLLTISTSLIADEDPTTTAGVTNGRGWKAMSATSRLWYIVGASDLILLATTRERVEGRSGDTVGSMFQCACTNGEILDGITAFYAADPIRAPITVTAAWLFYVERTKGTPPEKIEKEVSDLLARMARR